MNRNGRGLFPDLHHRTPVRIGVLSDTHGLLRPEVGDVLFGADLILHAGDVGDPSILCALEDIAPVVAVRGNTDKGSWSLQLPKTEMVPVGDAFVYLIHDIHELDLDPQSAGIRVIVHGHTHQPSIKHHQGVLYLNPGGAGHRRFDYPVSVATLDILHMDIVPRIISLDIG